MLGSSSQNLFSGKISLAARTTGAVGNHLAESVLPEIVVKILNCDHLKSFRFTTKAFTSGVEL